ncbi:hypothetical protein MTO96_031740 [Rhipicephalus appendiculatus]
MCLPGSTPQRFCGAQPQLTPCNSRDQQWYFHPHRRICLPYRHGRCGRKGNNAFESCVQCMNRCTDRKSEEVCKMVQRKNSVERTTLEQPKNDREVSQLASPADYVKKITGQK